MVQWLHQIWMSEPTLIVLWCLLASGIIAPFLVEWVRQGKKFDLFEAKQVFRGMYFLYFAVPSLYYIIYPHNFPYVYDFGAALRIVLLLALLGLASFYAGYRIRIPWTIPLSQAEWSDRRLWLVVGVWTALSFVCIDLLLREVNGACYYLTHLGQTNELLVGKIYLLWGILLFKLAAFLLWARILAAPSSRRLKLTTGVYLVLSLLLVAVVGARILLVIYIIELLVAYHYLKEPIGLKTIGILCAILIAIIGILGEYRTFTWQGISVCPAISDNAASSSTTAKSASTKKPLKAIQAVDQHSKKVGLSQYGQDFVNQLSNTTSDKNLLAERYIDNYFDSVRTTMVVVQNTPQVLSYQWGTTYLAILLQPIPHSWRPSIAINPDGFQIFSEAAGYSRILSIIGEAYVNFWVPGVILICLLFGILSRWAYEMLCKYRSNVGAILLYAAIVGGIMLETRGYVIGATSLFLMDLLPLAIAVWWLTWKRSRP